MATKSSYIALGVFELLLTLNDEWWQISCHGYCGQPSGLVDFIRQFITLGCVDVLISYFCMSVSWLCAQLNTNTPESVLQFVEYVKELLLFLHENYILPALHYILQGLQHAWQAFQDSCKWVAAAATPTSLSYPVPYQLPGRHWIGGIRQFERSAVRSACDHHWLALLDLSDSLILFWAPYNLSHCDCDCSPFLSLILGCLLFFSGEVSLLCIQNHMVSFTNSTWLYLQDTTASIRDWAQDLLSRAWCPQNHDTISLSYFRRKKQNEKQIHYTDTQPSPL